MRSPLLLLLAVVALAGCGQPEVEPTGKLDAGDHVTVVEQEGEFSLVETDEGKRVYVPSELLVNTNESSDNKTFAVTANTDIFESAPEAVPAPPAPRTPREISVARDQLPVLFITSSGREVYRSRQTAEPSYDPETREILWFAWTCTNPACPAKDKGTNGRPFLFTYPDPDWKVGPDGLVWEVPPNRTRGDTLVEQTGFLLAQCPECMKIRDVKNETEQQQMQYEQWVRQYILPEATARADQLNREHRRRIEVDRAQHPGN